MAERNNHHDSALPGELPKEVRQLVDHAVSQALQQQMPQLQAQLVQGVLAALPASSSASTSSGEGSRTLVTAVSNIHIGATQKEILRALLDAGSQYCSRIALFVVKAGAATGWQARGFTDENAIKDSALDLGAGPAAYTYRNRVTTPGNIAEMGQPFVERFGRPSNEQLLVLPLALKDKVAALVYADGGDTGRLDADALELLVIATSAWLEVISLRKQAVPKEESEPAGIAAAIAERPAPVAQTVSAYSDPFASHTPQHIPAPAPVQSAPAAAVAEVVEVAASSAAVAAAVAKDPLADLSPEDADTHRKAQRFARLLVDEIKLYNQAKVAEGRRNKDLYDRLKEDIEKSRGTFQKRYGATAAASVDYFQNELLRSLAEDDLSIMGANFRR